MADKIGWACGFGIYSFAGDDPINAAGLSGRAAFAFVSECIFGGLRTLVIGAIDETAESGRAGAARATPPDVSDDESASCGRARE